MKTTWRTMVTPGFQRPSSKKLVGMIESGEVETLIVKNLSRLGREYLQVGYYAEIYFLRKGIRFIAVNDGVDSLYSETNNFASMRNWFTAMRKTSKAQIYQ